MTENRPSDRPREENRKKPADEEPKIKKADQKRSLVKGAAAIFGVLGVVLVGAVTFIIKLILRK